MHSCIFGCELIKCHATNVNKSIFWERDQNLVHWLCKVRLQKIVLNTAHQPAEQCFFNFKCTQKPPDASAVPLHKSYNALETLAIQSVVFSPVALHLSLFEMQNLRPYSRSTDQNLYFDSVISHTVKFKKHCSETSNCQRAGGIAIIWELTGGANSQIPARIYWTKTYGAGAQ